MLLLQRSVSGSGRSVSASAEGPSGVAERALSAPRRARDRSKRTWALCEALFGSRECAAVFARGVWAVAALLVLLPGVTRAGDYSAMYVFGDILADQGNDVVANGLSTLPPEFYETTVKDGPLAVERLAKVLGVPLATSRHLVGPAVGTNFAAAGAATTGDGPKAFPQQLTAFEQSVGSDPAGLYVLYFGATEVNQAVGAPDPAVAEAFVQGAADGAVAGAERLIASGARNVLVMLLPDLGDVPVFVRFGVSGAATALAEQYNARLRTGIDALAARSPSARIVVFDTFTFFRRMVAFRDLMGFEFTGAASCLPDVTSVLLGGAPAWTPGCQAGRMSDRFLFFADVVYSAHAEARLAAALHSQLPGRLSGDRVDGDGRSRPGAGAPCAFDPAGCGLATPVRGYSRMYVFGDQLVDQGNDVMGRDFRTLPPPLYATTLIDGPLAVERVSDLLHMTLSLEPSSHILGLTESTNFAMRGAPAAGISTRSFRTQADAFDRSLLGADVNGLYVVFFGATEAMEGAHGSITSARAAMDSAADAVADGVRRLLAEGAVHMIVPNLPDIGQFPRFVSEGTSSRVSSLVLRYNARLAGHLAALRAEFPTRQMVPFDTYEWFEGLRQNARAFGFTYTGTESCLPNANSILIGYWPTFNPACLSGLRSDEFLYFAEDSLSAHAERRLAAALLAFLPGGLAGNEVNPPAVPRP